MTDDLMLRFALDHPSLVTEVGAKPSSGLTITAVKRTGAPGSTVKLGPPGGVMSAARAEGRAAFVQAFEGAIAAEDECLARMSRAMGIDTTGMTGRMGQPLDPAPGIGLAAWEGPALLASPRDEARVAFGRGIADAWHKQTAKNAAKRERRARRGRR